MKYEQPYGVSDPNASYINGNPATGTMGSIPPAASIENPQREIVNFISHSGLAPTDADLLQLAKSVQSGLVTYGLDQGAYNDIQITPTVPVTGYALGQRFVIKMSYSNTSQVTVNISGVGKVPLVHLNGSPINPGELIAGQMIEIAYDGAKFQMLAGGSAGGIVTMTAPRDFYVSDSIGNDSFDGTSPSLSGTITGPFKTIQKALATLSQYNLGGWNFNIHVADGTYLNSTQIIFPMPNGSGTVQLLGNQSNPANCLVYNNGSGSAFLALKGGQYVVNGFSFRTTAGQPGDAGNALYWANGSALYVSNCSYGNVSGNHLLVGPSASCLVSGTTTITGSAAGSHHCATLNGTLLMDTSTLWPITITAPVSFSSFCFAGNGGQARPVFSTITGAANVTGSRYNAVGNGVIETTGRGVNYLPGTIAGTLSTGGQYI